MSRVVGRATREFRRQKDQEEFRSEVTGTAHLIITNRIHEFRAAVASAAGPGSGAPVGGAKLPVEQVVQIGPHVLVPPVLVV